ncbi:putative tetratricopeptide-like helical domain-containing protein [Rosa chinensis]|uniref:Putative tetratricopeptide-like helical domain-containing protein n=1 Tax=Rosa chinensis TaxID=74649 RepID=A0A2P6RES5_ROSCH|nr:pentatricopeptide repeat-containing protein At5g66520 [Rosa chinensis]XP_040372445.1 pentatricopeptide repeat-containing protein At5g66520 [Rosa chinensis]PRQ44939.1 putative tetratricopeptide-like helical domain-containing protein [Rosa chinensis]
MSCWNSLLFICLLQTTLLQMSRLVFKSNPHPAPCLLLLQTCSSMNQLKQIHAQTLITGLARFTYITSKLLAFSALSEHGDLRHAETLFNRIPAPNVFDFNSMIMGFLKNSHSKKGLSVFTQMRRIGADPNARTFTVLVKACVGVPLLDQIYGQIMKFGHECDVYVTSSVISVYCKLRAVEFARRVFDESLDRNVVCWTSLVSGYCGNGLVDDARDLFDKMPERNDVSYSAMVSGYVQNACFNKAIDLFRDFKRCRANVRLTESLLVSVLNACASVGAFEEGKWIQTYLDDHGFEYGLELGTAGIDFYAKCGFIKDAKEIFDKMPRKDVTTWSAMIMGYATNGENDTGLELFAEMEKMGPKPNAVTFVGVLIACNHKTLINEAWRVLGRMSKIYSIAPEIEHYGCMVDLLARAGRVKEAEILIRSMAMEPDGAIWGSLLNGCLIHGHFELAGKVGKLLIQLEPQHSGRYVLLANMYAKMENWEDVLRLRKMMKDREVVSISAWSFIEIDGVVHKFLANDKSHSHSRSIYQTLSQLRKELESFSNANDSLLL